MSDRYADFVGGSFGKTLAKRLGLPRPVALRRYEPGQALLVGPALVAGVGAPSPVIARALSDSPTSHTASDERLGAVVFDASAATHPGQLEALREVVAPALKRLLPCARVVVVGRPPDASTTAATAAARV